MDAVRIIDTAGTQWLAAVGKLEEARKNFADLQDRLRTIEEKIDGSLPKIAEAKLALQRAQEECATSRQLFDGALQDLMKCIDAVCTNGKKSPVRLESEPGKFLEAEHRLLAWLDALECSKSDADALMQKARLARIIASDVDAQSRRAESCNAAIQGSEKEHRSLLERRRELLALIQESNASLHTLAGKADNVGTKVRQTLQEPLEALYAFDASVSHSPYAQPIPPLTDAKNVADTEALERLQSQLHIRLRDAFRSEGVSLPSAFLENVRVHIRWMIRRDMPEVLDTELQSFEYAWTEEDFLRCLRQRNCIGMVAERSERVVGFMIYELHKSKLHILNFAVQPDSRRRGVGAQMITKLIGKLSSHRRTKITAAVRETNLDAQNFFKASGFRAEKVLPTYYEDSGEAAYAFTYRVPGTLQTDEEEAAVRKETDSAEW
ncbi:MAG: ribosomal-protein-alanine acetyltransferase [Candidatus Peregrinibacteria bacterium Gr01-1014_25]|nr:MAG: ribosomal-protein-alanine acetyltransferase [Candidatus Peregrinibacteria bacterium Gr01-1014_25]